MKAQEKNHEDLFAFLKDKQEIDNKNKKINIFISYNNKDCEVAEEIAFKLSLEGWNIYIDKWKIKPGDSIVEFMNTGLKKANYFVLIWSKNSSKSKWVSVEWKSIVSNILDKKVKFLPVKIDDTPLPQLLSQFKYVILSNDVTDYYKLFEAVTGNNPISSYSDKIIKLFTELVFDAYAVKNIEVEDGNLNLEIIGTENFWSWETYIKEGKKNHHHDFKKIEWEKELGSNYGDQTKYFFIYRQLVACNCGAKVIFNQILDRK